MFGNKMKIFLITLCFMLSVSAVGAASDVGNVVSFDDDVETGDLDVDPPSGIDDINNVTYSKSEDTREPVIYGEDLSMYYKNGSRYEVSIYQDGKIINSQNNDSKVIFNVNGVNYTKELVNGKASIGINLNPGNYTITTFYHYTDGLATKTNNIEVLSTILANDVVKFFRNGTQYCAKFLDGCGSPLVNASVIFNINGVFYKKQTDDRGMAKLNINLRPGEYILTAMHPDALMYGSNITVLSTILANDVVKFFRNGTQYCAKFLDGCGSPLVNASVVFNINGVLYKKQTDYEGVARLNINLFPGKYILTAMHPDGLMYGYNITVLSTIHGDDIVKFFRNGTQYCAKFLDGCGSPLVNASVVFNINGVFYKKQTDDNGMARLNINLFPGEYILTAIHLNGEEKANIIKVLTTISAEDISLIENKSGVFVLKTHDGARNVSITINGVEYIVQTDDGGVATLNVSLSKGNHAVLSKNLNSGEEVFNTIHVMEDPAFIKYYSIYGVSPDGKYIMAIGRPSAAGELSKYGYTFYKSVFERICPCCRSDRLYWGIFWAGSETANWGVFPATGLKESGSAEGHIFCAKCDADFSVIDGKNHGGGSKNLIKVISTVSSSKDEAYILKNGQMPYSAL
ncbi:adhesin [uncultured Methanobrevibacter sp.]|uniref:adhesin n=1 Tax=uncultured Methanobrevibacter sp. TaxID=253161 RepID=UPI002594AD3F|nr:adhesin [uncultured Methanobrevibacter sp.]